MSLYLVQRDEKALSDVYPGNSYANLSRANHHNTYTKVLLWYLRILRQKD